MPNLNYKYNIPLLEGKKISSCTILSNSFGTSCEKIKFEDNSYIVLKILKAKKGNYDSIYYEGKSLKFMYNTFPELFPKVLYLNNNTLVLEYINHNNIDIKKEDTKNTGVNLGTCGQGVARII